MHLLQVEHDVKLALAKKRRKSCVRPSYVDILERKLQSDSPLRIRKAYHIAKVAIHSLHQKMYEFKDS